MKKIHLALLLCSLLFITCKKASVDAPEGINALIANEEKNCSSPCPPAIYEYRWNREIIYVKTCSSPLCLCSQLLYDAAGIRMTPPQGSTEFDIVRQATYVREVWKCPGK